MGKRGTKFICERGRTCHIASTYSNAIKWGEPADARDLNALRN